MHLTTRLIAAATLLSAVAATPALAHRQWLLPAATIFSGADDWVTVDAAVSNDLFLPDHFPMPTDGIEVWQPDGSKGKIENASTGRYRSTFDVHLVQKGTWKIGTSGSGLSGSFKVNGEEWRLGGRRGPPAGAPGAPQAGGGAQPPAGAGGRPMPRSVASVEEIPAGATEVKLTESARRNEIFVTSGTPTDTVFQPTGKGLEMLPLTHPSELVATETARLKFLVDGKPVAGLKVTAIPGGKRYRDGEDALEVTTDAQGVAAFTWPTAGMYWLDTELTDDHPSNPRANQRRMNYTATLEVMAP